jgi:Mg2+ and Co2+ transporter CorA
MLSAYLFDERQGKRIDAWADALDDLRESQLLWLDLVEPSSEERHEVEETLGLNGKGAALSLEGAQPGFDQSQAYLRVTAVATGDADRDTAPQPVALVCLVGENWVLTAHDVEIGALEDFRARAGGKGEVGVLDAPSFLAKLLEWVVTSYLRAFDQIEADLEEFDVRVLRSPRRDADRQIGELVEARRRVGELRRSLAPHREVFAALSESEFDPVSTEESAKRFSDLAAKTETALAAARDAKDAVIGSFDVLIARTEHRTNEIMKILTLASILLLPGALIAGVMGMNFKPSIFDHAVLFWVVNGAIVLIALVTLALARAREWI